MPYITIVQDKPEGNSIEVPGSATVFDIQYLMQWAREQYENSSNNGPKRLEYYIDKIAWQIDNKFPKG